MQGRVARPGSSSMKSSLSESSYRRRKYALQTIRPNRLGSKRDWVWDVGMAGWSNSDDHESLQSLQTAVNRGCNFFDTAYAYGEGRSENLLGQTVRANRAKRLYTATKIPPRNKQWPARAEYTLQESYPPDHVEEFVHRSLESSGSRVSI